MGLSWWDIAQIVVPVAATVVGGPVGGIVASGAMGAGTGLAKGEGAKGALLRGGLGAGTGALTAGATGALSKGAEAAATKGVEKAAMDASMNEILKAGMDSSGMPIVNNMAMNAGSAAAAAAQNSGKNLALTKFADLTKNARGGKDSGAMLKTVQSGANALGSVAQVMQPPPQQQMRFSDLPRIRRLGYAPDYQYGASSAYAPGMSAYATPTVSFIGNRGY